MSKIARIYQGINEIQKYYQGGVLQRLFFDWKHYIGNELNIEYAKECAGRNVVISGKTYQNLCIEDTSKETSLLNFSNYNMFKIGTYYTIILEITVDNASQINFAFNTSSHVLVSPKGHNKGIYKFKVRNTNTSLGEISSVRLLSLKQDGYTTCLFRNVIILEGDYTNIDLPNSINGIESVAEREFVKSKNLFNLHDWYDNNIWFDVTDNQIRYLKNSDGANGVYMSKINKLLKGTYRISLEGEGEGAVYSRIEVYSVVEGVSTKIKDTNVNSNLYNSLSFILNEDMDIKFKFFVVDSDNTVRNGYMIKNIQLEQNSVSTDYEPFYEYYPATIRNYNYKCGTDNIVLPNGVKNSIDTIDGKKIHVQRVEKIIVTKQKDATKFGTISNTYGHKLYCINSNIYGEKGKCDNAEIGVISNKFIGIADDEWRSSEKVNCCFMNINGVVHFLVDKTEFPSQETFNDWLEKNEVTVYYPLAEPIYTYLESGLYDDITLPDGTKNEISYNGENHIHTRKIDKIVLDGSDDEKWRIEKNNQFTLKKSDSLPKDNYYKEIGGHFNKIIASVKPTSYSNLDNATGYGINYTYFFRLNLEEVDATNGATVDDLRAYLKENPITCYLEFSNYIETELYYDDITYKLNEPLRSLPNGVCDTIERNKLIQRVGKIIFDGSNDENWEVRNSLYFSLNHGSTKTPKEFLNPNLTEYLNAISNISISHHTVLDNKNGFGITYCYFWRLNLEEVDTTKGATVDDLKAYLQENPVIVYYELATPIKTEITPDMILINGEPITDTVNIELPDGTKDSIENDYYVKRVGKFIIDGKDGTYIKSGASTSNLAIYVVRYLGIQITLKNMNTNYIYQCDSNIDMSKYITVGRWAGDTTSGSVVFKVPTEEYLWSDIRNAFLENPITLYVELATPVKIPLFSIKEGLTTLKSTNNIAPQIELDCLVRDDFQNMCDNKWEKGDIDLNTGVNKDRTDRIRLINYIKVKPNTSYKIDITNLVLGKNIGLRCYDISKTYISGGLIGDIKSSTYPFTTPEDCYYIRFIVEANDANFKIYLKEVIN